MNEDTNRRTRVVYIDEHEILCMLAKKHVGGDTIRLPEFDLPETAKVLNVFSDHSRRVFGFVIQDESFDIVELGMEMPRATLRWHWVPIVKKT